MKHKKVTIDDIASATGFSRATVSVALSDRLDLRIADETREAVRSTAASLSYTFASTGRASRAGRTALLFLYEDIGSSHIGTSFFVRVAEELKKIGSERGFIVLEASAAGMDSINLRRLVIDFKPAACIVYASSSARVAQEAAPELPLLFLQADTKEEFNLAAAYQVDDIAVGINASQLLLDSGKHRALMFFPNNVTHRCQMERIEGFKTRFEEGGGSCSLVTLSSFNGSHLEIEIEAAVRECTGHRETGHRGPELDSAYFFSDAFALIGLRVLNKAGYRIPQDVAVVGTDNLYWGAFSTPSLSTMDLNEALFAKRIADDVQSNLAGSAWQGITTRIPVSIIKREST